MAVAALVSVLGCNGCRKSDADRVPPVPASADPEGKDIVPGAIVAAEEKPSGIRLYKVLEVNWFPDPIGDELVMIAYSEKGDTYEQCRELWIKHNLTITLPKARVAKHMFIRREHRIIATEAVSDADKNLKPGDPQPKPSS